MWGNSMCTMVINTQKPSLNDTKPTRKINNLGFYGKSQHGKENPVS